jgi:signal transduction histidine kinase
LLCDFNPARMRGGVDDEIGNFAILGSTAKNLVWRRAMVLLRSSVAFAILSAACLANQASSADQIYPRGVLIINQSNSYRPWPNRIISEIRSAINGLSGQPISVYAEDLDLYRFNGPTYLQEVRNYFGAKYRDKSINAVISIGASALDYALHLRESLWPGVPVLFAAVDRKTADVGNIPGVTGTTIQLHLGDMVRAAKAIIPNIEHFALVGDRLETQLYYSQFAQELVDYSRRFDFIDLMGLPLSDVKERVARLPVRTAVLYIGINSDQSATYVSAEVAPVVAAAANSPTIVSIETYFGTGAVGGYLLSPTDVGRETAQLTIRVLNGENPSTIPVTMSSGLRLIFDWRQLRRWEIDPDRLPAGAEIQFRRPSIWDQYRWEIIAALAILIIQTGMIAKLGVEQRRRRIAEEESRRRILQVIHLNRTATAAALSASVAHELNQPLGSILNAAETANLLLSDDKPNITLLKELVADICRDDQRASDVIRHLRDLLKRRSEQELQTFDISDVIDTAMSIVRPEAAKRGVALDTARTNRAFLVRADQVQLQQVILNLVNNGMDAVSSAAPDRRRLTIQAIPSGASDVEVVVSDLGAGIAEADLKNIFEAFYTTKPGGTGLGLSIARTIIEAYGGKIWAENRSGGGAAFRITLPLAAT